jgi:RNA polymerase sigma factor (sigma-70 family)
VGDATAEDQVGAGARPGHAAPVDDAVPADAVLIAAVRSGDTAAYGVLYERHLVAAKRAASSARPADRDDLVAESFAQVLRMLRAGRGPDETLRPYLLTTLRNALTDSYRRNAAHKVVAEVPDLPPPGGENPVETRAHALVATSAFQQLPQRWRHVLWYTEVEQRSPGEVAELLGLTPNGVAALAYRAREALRQAYLDQYLPAGTPRSCRPFVELLPKWVRHKLPAPTAKRITAHVTTCRGCRRLVADLEELNQQLPMLLGPLVAAAPLAIAGMTGTAGTLAATGVTTGAATGLAEAASTGLSIASWTTAAKTMLAGAAVVATTALGVAGTPSTAAPGHHDVATRQAPRDVHRAPPRSQLAASSTGQPASHDSASGTRAGKHDAKTAKAKKKTKQATKAVKKKAKSAQKKAKKATKKAGAAKHSKKAKKAKKAKKVHK